MEIDSRETSDRNGRLEFIYDVQTHGCSKSLWFTLDNEHEELISDRSDAALSALLIPAMERGEDIRVNGTVSERLYYILQHHQQAVLQALHPSLNRVSIHPEEIKPKKKTGTGVATGFTGGIDSFATLADHYHADTPDGFHITHLLFNNVGSHGRRNEELYKERYEYLQPAVDRIGLPLIAVNSNIDSFYETIGFQESHTQRNAAVALLLQQGISRFLYSSTFDYQSVRISDTYDMAYSDPVTLPLLSTEGLDALSVGSEYSRVEKTLKVTKLKESYRSLNICADGNTAGNCSECWKCRRTLLTLEIAGMLNRYSEVFDFDAYRRGRKLYLARVLASNDPLLKEIVEFAEAEGYEFPTSSVLHSKIYDLIKPVYRSGVSGYNSLRQGIPAESMCAVKRYLR